MKKNQVIIIAKAEASVESGFYWLVNTMFFGKFDLAGSPYINHLQKVTSKVDPMDKELQMIAYGHDLFEDTDVTISDLVELGINARVIKGISDITKWNGQCYEEYKIQVKSNPDAIKVKIADLEHNMDITRLKKPLTEKDLLRIKRYHGFWLELKELDK